MQSHGSTQSPSKTSDVLCLPIIINHRPENTHETVIAAAAAAFLAYSQSLPTFTPEEIANYLAWSTPEMRKTARRARGSRWLAAQDLTPLQVKDDNAVILHPVRGSLMPKEVKRLQVTGMDYPKQGWLTNAHPDIIVGINPALELSTGKTVAQVLHALHRLTAAVIFPDKVDDATLGFDVQAVSGLVHKPMSEWVIQFRDHLDTEATLLVTDAGHTEIEAGSVTVSALVCA